MRGLLLAIERRTTAFALWGACFMLAVASAVGLYQILTRFIFLEPAEWSEISVRFALIWMAIAIFWRRSGERARFFRPSPNPSRRRDPQRKKLTPPSKARSTPFAPRP